MRINIRSVVFISLIASVFLIAFEQIYIVAFGFDSFLKPYRIAMAPAVILLLMHPLRAGKKAKRLILLFAGIYSLGIISAACHAIFSQISFSQTLYQAQLFFFAFFFFIAAVITIQRPEQILTVLKALLLSAIVSTLFFLFLHGGENTYRMSAFFRNPNHYSFLLGISFLISFFFITQNRRNFLLLTLLSIWMLSSALLIVLSGSRGALISTLLSVAIILYRQITERKAKKKIALLMSAFFVVAAVLAIPDAIDTGLVGSNVLGRFSAGQIATGAGRFDIWRAGLLAAEDVFFTGIGMGQYVEVHSHYIRQLSGPVYHTAFEYDLGIHSEYLNLLVEFGLIALIGYGVAVFSIWRGIRTFGRAHPEWIDLCSFLEALLALNLVFSATQDMYFISLNWVVFGLCASLININAFLKSNIIDRSFPYTIIHPMRPHTE